MAMVPIRRIGGEDGRDRAAQLMIRRAEELGIETIYHKEIRENATLVRVRPTKAVLLALHDGPPVE